MVPISVEGGQVRRLRFVTENPAASRDLDAVTSPNGRDPGGKKGDQGNGDAAFTCRLVA